MSSSTTNKKQLLVILSRFPYPLDKGDKLRAYYQIKELSKTYRVTVLAITDKVIEPKFRNEIESICSELVVCRINFLSKVLHLITTFLFTKKPLQTGYFYSWKIQRVINQLISNNSFSHIFCQLIRTSEYVKNIHTVPKTLDYMDALSKGIERRIKQQPFISRWIFIQESRRLKAYEKYIFDFFENKIIISEQDKELISHPEKNLIQSIPNGIDEKFFEQKNVEKEFDFVFVGNMSYAPNIDAVNYIVKKIMPYFPHTKLLIAGSSPGKPVHHLTQLNNNVKITGWVEDVRDAYRKGAIFLAPMMIGTGMQNKLLEAMALGIPCITTPLANNAIQAEHGKEILVGDGLEDLVDCINLLKNDQELYSTISTEGSNYVRNNFSWEESVKKLIGILEKTSN